MDSTDVEKGTSSDSSLEYDEIDLDYLRGMNRPRLLTLSSSSSKSVYRYDSDDISALTLSKHLSKDYEVLLRYVTKEKKLMQGTLSALLSQQRSSIRDSFSEICHYRSRLVDTTSTINTKRSENKLRGNHPTNVIDEDMYGDGHQAEVPLYPQHDRLSVRDKVKQLLKHPEVLKAHHHSNHSNSAADMTSMNRRKKRDEESRPDGYSGASDRHDLFHYGYNSHLLPKGQPRHHRHSHEQRHINDRANDKQIRYSPRRNSKQDDQERQRPHHLSISYSHGSIYNNPASVWEDTTYQHTLLLNLHKKLLLKMTFTALRHNSQAIIRARQAAVKSHRNKGDVLYRLCFQSFVAHLLWARHVIARATAVTDLLILRKYQYPAFQKMKRIWKMIRREESTVLRVVKKRCKLVQWHHLHRWKRQAKVIGYEKGCHRLGGEAYLRCKYRNGLQALKHHHIQGHAMKVAKERVHRKVLDKYGMWAFSQICRTIQNQKIKERCHNVLAEYLLQHNLGNTVSKIQKYADLRTYLKAVWQEALLYVLHISYLRLTSSLSDFHKKNDILRMKMLKAVKAWQTRQYVLSIALTKHFTHVRVFSKLLMMKSRAMFRLNYASLTFKICRCRVAHSRFYLLANEMASAFNNRYNLKKGLHHFKEYLSLGRKARLLKIWSKQRLIRNALSKAHQAWIYAYVKKSVLKVALETRLKNSTINVNNSKKRREHLHKAQDWKHDNTSHHLHQHTSQSQQLEASLIELRKQAVQRIQECMALDMNIVQMKLKMIVQQAKPFHYHFSHHFHHLERNPCYNDIFELQPVLLEMKLNAHMDERAAHRLDIVSLHRHRRRIHRLITWSTISNGKDIQSIFLASLDDDETNNDFINKNDDDKLATGATLRLGSSVSLQWAEEDLNKSYSNVMQSYQSRQADHSLLEESDSGIHSPRRVLRSRGRGEVPIGRETRRGDVFTTTATGLRLVHHSPSRVGAHKGAVSHASGPSSQEHSSGSGSSGSSKHRHSSGRNKFQSITRTTSGSSRGLDHVNDEEGHSNTAYITKHHHGHINSDPRGYIHATVPSHIVAPRSGTKKKTKGGRRKSSQENRSGSSGGDKHSSSDNRSDSLSPSHPSLTRSSTARRATSADGTARVHRHGGSQAAFSMMQPQSESDTPVHNHPQASHSAVDRGAGMHPPPGHIGHTGGLMDSLRQSYRTSHPMVHHTAHTGANMAYFSDSDGSEDSGYALGELEEGVREALWQEVSITRFQDSALPHHQEQVTLNSTLNDTTDSVYPGLGLERSSTTRAWKAKNKLQSKSTNLHARSAHTGLVKFFKKSVQIQLAHYPSARIQRLQQQQEQTEREEQEKIEKEIESNVLHTASMALEKDGSYSSPMRIHTQGVREMSPRSNVEVRVFDSPTTTSINTQGALNSSLQSIHDVLDNAHFSESNHYTYAGGNGLVEDSMFSADNSMFSHLHKSRGLAPPNTSTSRGMINTSSSSHRQQHRPHGDSTNMRDTLFPASHSISSQRGSHRTKSAYLDDDDDEGDNMAFSRGQPFSNTTIATNSQLLDTSLISYPPLPPAATMNNTSMVSSERNDDDNNNKHVSGSAAIMESVGCLDDALWLLKATRWALYKLHRHSILSKKVRIVSMTTRHGRLSMSMQHWKQAYEDQLVALEQCHAHWQRNALIHSFVHLYWLGVKRMHSLTLRLKKQNISFKKKKALKLWWRAYRLVTTERRVMRKNRKSVLNKSLTAWIWCKAWRPGMTLLQYKVKMRVVLPLLLLWKKKTKQFKKLRKVFSYFFSAWEHRIDNVMNRSHFLRKHDCFIAWVTYKNTVQYNKYMVRLLERAYLFRGTTLVSRCFYGWIEYLQGVLIEKRAVLRKERMIERLVIDAIRTEANDVKEQSNVACHHHSFYWRGLIFQSWKRVIQYTQYTLPAAHYGQKRIKIYFQVLRLQRRIREMRQSLLPYQIKRKKTKMLLFWYILSSKSQRYREGLQILERVRTRYKARGMLARWPGRTSFAKAEAMKHLLQEKGRGKSVLVDVETMKEKAKRIKRQQKEEERSIRSFITHRQAQPLEQRAALFGFIYSAEDSRAVVDLFNTLRIILLSWYDTAHDEKRIRGVHNLIQFKHQRFLVEHHMRKWIGKASATTHRLSLWVNKKFASHSHKKIGIHSRAIATEHLLKQYAEMDAGYGHEYTGSLRLIHDDEDEDDLDDILHIQKDTSFKRWTE